jgi:hypothetical protein
MHAVPSPTKVVTLRCQQNILCKISHSSYIFDEVKEHTPLQHQQLNMTMMHGHTSKDSTMQITSYTFDNNIKDNLHLYWTTSTTNALSSIYVHTINKSQFNKESSPHHYQHIHYHNYQPTSQQLHTISHNSSKGENRTHYDKHHIQHLATIHTSSYNHIKLSTKDLPSIWSLRLFSTKFVSHFTTLK